MVHRVEFVHTYDKYPFHLYFKIIRYRLSRNPTLMQTHLTPDGCIDVSLRGNGGFVLQLKK